MQTPEITIHIKQTTLADRRRTRPCAEDDYGQRPECPLADKPEKKKPGRLGYEAGLLHGSSTAPRRTPFRTQAQPRTTPVHSDSDDTSSAGNGPAGQRCRRYSNSVSTSSWSAIGRETWAAYSRENPMLLRCSAASHARDSAQFARIQRLLRSQPSLVTSKVPFASLRKLPLTRLCSTSASLL